MSDINNPVAVPPPGYSITCYEHKGVYIANMAVRIADGVTVPMPLTWYWNMTDSEKVEAFNQALLDKVDAQLMRL